MRGKKRTKTKSNAKTGIVESGFRVTFLVTAQTTHPNTKQTTPETCKSFLHC
jgi:hypothetical protein